MKTPAMTIRPLTAADRGTVLDVIRQTGMFTPEEERVAAEILDVYLGQPDQRDYRIEVIEPAAGGVVGFVCYGPTPMTEGTVDLYWMAVHPGRHRQGFGRALVRRVEQAVREARGRLIVIETSSRARYASTRQFYQGLGYAETARLPDFYRPGDDLVVYCKYLTPEGP